MGLVVAGRISGFLSGVWCIRIAARKVKALEEAFGEPLPCSKTITRLSALPIFFALGGSALFRVSRVGFLLTNTGSTLSLVLLTGLLLRAISVPLRALQTARRMNVDSDGEWEQKMASAINALRRFQFAVLLANSSMVFNVVGMAAIQFVFHPIVVSVNDYLFVLDVVSNGSAVTWGPNEPKNSGHIPYSPV